MSNNKHSQHTPASHHTNHQHTTLDTRNSNHKIASWIPSLFLHKTWDWKDKVMRWSDARCCLHVLSRRKTGWDCQDPTSWGSEGKWGRRTCAWDGDCALRTCCHRNLSLMALLLLLLTIPQTQIVIQFGSSSSKLVSKWSDATLIVRSFLSVLFAAVAADVHILCKLSLAARDLLRRWASSGGYRREPLTFLMDPFFFLFLASAQLLRYSLLLTTWWWRGRRETRLFPTPRHQFSSTLHHQNQLMLRLLILLLDQYIEAFFVHFITSTQQQQQQHSLAFFCSSRASFVLSLPGISSLTRSCPSCCSWSCSCSALVSTIFASCNQTFYCSVVAVFTFVVVAVVLFSDWFVWFSQIVC